MTYTIEPITYEQAVANARKYGIKEPWSMGMYAKSNGYLSYLDKLNSSERMRELADKVKAGLELTDDEYAELYLEANNQGKGILNGYQDFLNTNYSESGIKENRYQRQYTDETGNQPGDEAYYRYVLAKDPDHYNSYLYGSLADDYDENGNLKPLTSQLPADIPYMPKIETPTFSSSLDGTGRDDVLSQLKSTRTPIALHFANRPDSKTYISPELANGYHASVNDYTYKPESGYLAGKNNGLQTIEMPDVQLDTSILNSVPEIDEAGLSEGELDQINRQQDKLNNSFAKKPGLGFSGAASKISSVLGGITGLVENYDRGASIQDTEGLKNQIKEYSNIGRGTYNDYDQLASDFGQLDLTPDIDEDEIRGLTTGQKWGNLASGTATGLSAGAAVGSIIPGIGTGIGAAVGAGIGAITSGLSILAGDEEARRQKEYLEDLKSVASQKATINLGLAHEDIRERQNREGIYNLSAQGGQIKRMSSLQEFADTVLGSSKKNDVSHSARIIRSKCKGGTMVRVKVR